MKLPIITNEILIPKRIFSSKVDKDLELDSLLPEFCPDIARIVKVDCTPFPESVSVSDGKATLKGKAVYDILYETDYKSRLRCCSFTQEFSQSVPIPKTACINIQALASPDCERIGCKLLSPRRVAVKATLATKFDIEGETPTRAVAVTESKDVFFRKKTIGFDGRTSAHESLYKFSESLALTQSEKAIGEIICGNVFLRTPQITLSSGHAEIKSIASIHTLYEEEGGEGKYFTSVKTVPISIDYSNELIAEHKHIAFALSAAKAELSPELDQYGESRVIKADFSVSLNMTVKDQFAGTVADDLFEKDFDSVPIRTTVSLPSLHSCAENGFAAEAKLAPMTPKPESLLDSSARDCGATAEKCEDGVKISGAFVVTLLCETAEGIQSFDHSVPYERELSLELPEPFVSIEANVAPDEVIATLHSDGSATVRIIATAKLCVQTEHEESFISEVTKRVARDTEELGSLLVYCFPTEDEDLWSIAKLYHTDPEGVRSANPSYFDDAGTPFDRTKPILLKV